MTARGRCCDRGAGARQGIERRARMRLATLKSGSLDGRLVVVSPDAARMLPV
ncbi:MAG: hypothetical protein G3W67_20915, partial [Xanthomonas perforans]|nr:hypothetical protein [Xanthomonas perforans]